MVLREEAEQHARALREKAEKEEERLAKEKARKEYWIKYHQLEAQYDAIRYGTKTADIPAAAPKPQPVKAAPEVQDLPPPVTVPVMKPAKGEPASASPSPPPAAGGTPMSRKMTDEEVEEFKTYCRVNTIPFPSNGRRLATPQPTSTTSVFAEPGLSVLFILPLLVLLFSFFARRFRGSKRASTPIPETEATQPAAVEKLD